MAETSWTWRLRPRSRAPAPGHRHHDRAPPQAMLGPRITTRMGSYLSAPVVPTVIGFQPRLQFLHEEDALAAMEHVTLAGEAGNLQSVG